MKTTRDIIKEAMEGKDELSKLITAVYWLALSEGQENAERPIRERLKTLPQSGTQQEVIDHLLEENPCAQKAPVIPDYAEVGAWEWDLDLKAAGAEEPLELLGETKDVVVGEPVLILRGGHDSPSPGQFRYVAATLLEILPYGQAECRLEQDDPYALNGYCTKKGDVGAWSLSIIYRRKTGQ